MGVNAPISHQRIISKLVAGLGHLYYTLGQIPFEPLPEVMIDESQTSPTPDVVLYDNESGKNVVIIEIASASGAKKDFEKVIQLMHDYEVPEGFVYNYIIKEWRKYSLKDGEVKDNPSFCNAIGYDLKQFI
jgi:Uma2 family endonuclease